MQTTNVQDYIDYFRQLAVSHTQLQHNPTGESGDADPGTCRFARWTADEILTGLRSKVSFPALMLELYETQTSYENEYDVRNNYSGAFSIAASALPENHTSEIEALATAESIMTDMLQKIWNDHYGVAASRCSTPFEYFDLGYAITPFGPILNNQFGYRCEFTFKLRRDMRYNKPPAEDVFI